MNKKEKYPIWSLCCKCDYEWKPRIKNPKSCPRCKTRLDFGKAKIKGRQIKIKL